MMRNYLSFEQPVADLDQKIEELQYRSLDSASGLAYDLERLRKERETCVEKLYLDLTPWEIAQVARHPDRPYTFDYIEKIFSDFSELHGDRMFGDDPAIIGGLAYLDQEPVMLLGHQKGREIKEKVFRNFGMARPEGYRKAIRLMALAQKFQIPVITFVDTPGAYPGIDAEERGQSEAIGRCIYTMMELAVPTISIIIGEGGSGGALALAVADRVIMLEYATYAVISPEGCSSILWRSVDHAPEAAKNLGVTAAALFKRGLINHVLSEPKGGAHQSLAMMSATIKDELVASLKKLKSKKIEDTMKKRYDRFMSFGSYEVSL